MDCVAAPLDQQTCRIGGSDAFPCVICTTAQVPASREVRRREQPELRIPYVLRRWRHCARPYISLEGRPRRGGREKLLPDHRHQGKGPATVLLNIVVCRMHVLCTALQTLANSMHASCSACCTASGALGIFVSCWPFWGPRGGAHRLCATVVLP